MKRSRLLGVAIATVMCVSSVFGLVACSKEPGGYGDVSDSIPGGTLPGGNLPGGTLPGGGGNSDNNNGSASVCTVTYNANGGTIIGANTTATTGSDGKLTSLLSKTFVDPPENKEFVGWYTAADGGTEVTTRYTFTTTTATIYAHWVDTAGGQTTTYTITFYANNGTNASETRTTNANGILVGAAPTFTYDNHTFDGWFTAATDGNKIANVATYTYDKSMPLYAQWTPVSTGGDEQGGEQGGEQDSLPVLEDNQIGLKFTDDTYIIIEANPSWDCSKLILIYVWGGSGQVIGNNNLTWGEYYDCSCALGDAKGINLQAKGNDSYTGDVSLEDISNGTVYVISHNAWGGLSAK